MNTQFQSNPSRSGFAPLHYLLLLLIACACVGQVRAADAIKSPLKSYEGVLKTGIIAVGVETTGVILTTKADGIYELDLKTAELKASADKLAGKKVVVTGEYKPISGTEKKERRIIKVKTLTAAVTVTK